jgi:DNA-binding HxlR family transcriptional regulator
MDYLIDYRIRRYLRACPEPPNFAQLSRDLQLSDSELIDALERLVDDGYVEKSVRTAPMTSGMPRR